MSRCLPRVYASGRQTVVGTGRGAWCSGERCSRPSVWGHAQLAPAAVFPTSFQLLLCFHLPEERIRNVNVDGDGVCGSPSFGGNWKVALGRHRSALCCHHSPECSHTLESSLWGECYGQLSWHVNPVSRGCLPHSRTPDLTTCVRSHTPQPPPSNVIHLAQNQPARHLVALPSFSPRIQFHQPGGFHDCKPLSHQGGEALPARSRP